MILPMPIRRVLFGRFILLRNTYCVLLHALLRTRESLTSSRPIQWGGIPLITKRLSFFAESRPFELSPVQVLQTLQRLTPPVLRLKCFYLH